MEDKSETIRILRRNNYQQCPMPVSIKKNVGYLLLIQGGNYILPLLLFPYLGRILGQEQFGVLAYCQAIAQYFIIFTDFGFSLTATRRIAIARSDSQELSVVYSATMYVRILFTVVAFFALLASVFGIARIHEYVWILAGTFIGVIGSALFPIWLFQGLEQMKTLMLANMMSKVLTFATVLLFVQSQNDTALAAACIGLGNLSMALMAAWIIWRKKLVKFQFPGWLELGKAARDGWPIFLSTVVSSSYMNLNAILLNEAHGSAAVGVFSMADKIRLAVQAAISTIVQAYYPRISLQMHENLQQALASLKKIFFIVGGMSLLACIGLQISASWLILTFIPKFAASIPLLRLEAMLLPVISVALVYGHLGLLTLGKASQISRVYLLVGVLHIFYAIPLTKYAAASGTILSLLITESLASILICWYFHRVKSHLKTINTL
ncbi:flippase [Undibacterium sp. SXout11W]|uniref:flippase n=1 Tax=Undibacterium sp. SXout11W TaxID=3413050 RepID=UPI003BF3E38C